MGEKTQDQDQMYQSDETENLNITLTNESMKRIEEISLQMCGYVDKRTAIVCSLKKYFEDYDEKEYREKVINSEFGYSDLSSENWTFERGEGHYSTYSRESFDICVRVPKKLKEKVEEESKLKEYERLQISHTVQDSLNYFSQVLQVRENVIREKYQNTKNINHIVKNNYDADIDFSDIKINNIKNSKKYRIPALVSSLKNGEKEFWERDELIEKIVDVFDCSSVTAKNYISSIEENSDLKFGNFCRQVEDEMKSRFGDDVFDDVDFEFENMRVSQYTNMTDDVYMMYVQNICHYLNSKFERKDFNGKNDLKIHKILGKVVARNVEMHGVDLDDDLNSFLQQFKQILK